MSIKFADEIIEEIKERGQIQVSDGCVVGEEFEKIYDKESSDISVHAACNSACFIYTDAVNAGFSVQR